MRPRVIDVALIAALLFATSRAFATDEALATARPLPYLEPAIVEYRWTFAAPEWVVEARRIDVRAIDPATRRERVDFNMLEFPLERRAIGRFPEFSCKYADFGLPNECRTTWRTVYVDVPVPSIRHDHVNVDVPDWQWRNAHTTVDVLTLVWKEQHLIVSLPAIAVRTSTDR
jgi:hypothetical protein